MPLALNAPLFAALAPEFAATDPAVLALVAAEAARFVPEGVWGAKANLGLVYMTAHMLKQGKDAASNTGALVSTKVGDLERKYANSSSPEDDDLDSTIYGQRYKEARKSLPISPFVVS